MLLLIIANPKVAHPLALRLCNVPGCLARSQMRNQTRDQNKWEQKNRRVQKNRHVRLPSISTCSLKADPVNSNWKPENLQDRKFCHFTSAASTDTVTRFRTFSDSEAHGKRQL